MRERIRALSRRAEFSIVIGLTFGLHFLLFLVRGATRGFRPSIEFTDARTLILILLELLLATALGFFLRIRGWRLSQFPMRVTLGSTAMGIGLWLASHVLYFLFYWAALMAQGENSPLRRVSFHGQVGVGVTLLLCLVNPLFEEVLTLGYVVRFLEDHGAVFAIGVSAALRLIVHAYQGPMAVVSVLPLGLLFGFFYWRSRNLWPPVLAHAILDFIGLQSLR